MKKLEQDTAPEIRKAIDDYVAKVQEHKNAYFAKHYSRLTPPKMELKVMNKFYKVIENDTFGSGSRVFCFIDKDGNILKPANWSTPANGVRGNVNEKLPPVDGSQFYKNKLKLC